MRGPAQELRSHPPHQVLPPTFKRTYAVNRGPSAAILPARKFDVAFITNHRLATPMAAYSHLLLTFALTAAAASLSATAAETPKDSPFAQAGGAKAVTKDEVIEFAGVSTVGKKTMINLYDREAKGGFWVELGTTSDGVTAVKYDSAHDQVTIRRNGAEKVLSLRSASAVVAGSAASAMPVSQPIAPVAPIAGSSQTVSTPTPTSTPAMQASAATPAVPADAQTRARQEEEARMLVSDLLEIGIAQRKAYEDAQRKAATQGQQPAGTPAAQPNQPATPEPSNQTANTQPTPTGG